MTIALVTDSTAYLPDDLRVVGEGDGSAAALSRVTVVPLHVLIGGREGREGPEVSSTELAEALGEFRPVRTASPGPGDLVAAYEAARDAGATGVVSVHLSGELSGTVGAARVAAQQVDLPVEVIDCRTVGMAMGHAVVSGRAVAAAGGSLQEVAAAVRARAAASTLLFYVDTLEHLRRGGRIGAAQAFFGSALAIKPLLKVVDGRVAALEKVRTSSRALARLETLALEAAGDAPHGVDLVVHHLGNESKAQSLLERLTSTVPDVHRSELVELGPVVGAHVGTGTIGVVVAPRLVTDMKVSS